MTRSFISGNELPELLVVEPDPLIRSTVAGVCKQLNLARVHQAASVQVAQLTVDSRTMDLMLVSLNEGEQAFTFLERLRAGEWTPMTDVPLAVTSDHAHQELVTRVKPLAVRRLLLQPYKIKDIVQTIESLRQELEADA